MGFESWKHKPTGVQEAALDGDKAALSAMGRKGAETANANRERRADETQTLAMLAEEKAAAEERVRAESTNEHIIDADGNDLTEEH